jgi:hypothetical protein
MNGFNVLEGAKMVVNKCVVGVVTKTSFVVLLIWRPYSSWSSPFPLPHKVFKQNESNLQIPFGKTGLTSPERAERIVSG